MLSSLEIFVEKEADDTSHNIVGGGGDPIACIAPGVQPSQIPKAEHNAAAYCGIDNSYQNETEKGWVKYFFQKIAHKIPPDSHL